MSRQIDDLAARSDREVKHVVNQYVIAWPRTNDPEVVIQCKRHTFVRCVDVLRYTRALIAVAGRNTCTTNTHWLEVPLCDDSVRGDREVKEHVQPT